MVEVNMATKRQALGRGLEAYDQPTVRAIVRDAAKDNYRLPAMISAIINSKPFQMRKRV